MTEEKPAAESPEPVPSRGKNVFIGWAGDVSRRVARALHQFLPLANNHIRPWMSEVNIDKGALWSEELSKQLGMRRVGIFCLTPDNLESKWILFEAGALSARLDDARVCPFLFHLTYADIEPPLSRFMLTLPEKEDTKKLLLSINRALGSPSDEELADRSFELAWPSLNASFKKIREEAAPKAPRRNDREILEEILSLVRDTSRLSSFPMITSVQGVGRSQSAFAHQLRHEVDLFRPRQEYVILPDGRFVIVGDVNQLTPLDPLAKEEPTTKNPEKSEDDPEKKG